MNIRTSLERINAWSANIWVRLAAAAVCTLIYTVQINEFSYLRLLWQIQNPILHRLTWILIIFGPHLGLVLIWWLAMSRPNRHNANGSTPVLTESPKED